MSFECIVGVACEVPIQLVGYVNPSKFHVTWFYAGFLTKKECDDLDSEMKSYSTMLENKAFTIRGYDFFGAEKNMPVLLVEPAVQDIMDDVARKHGVWRDFQKEEMKDTPYFQRYHITVTMPEGECLEDLFEKVLGCTFYAQQVFRKELKNSHGTS
jgi:hypothetical protein